MPEPPKPPTGAWLTRQLRRAEQHADNVAPLLELALAEVLAAAGDVAARGFTARATALTAAAPGVTSASTMICLKPTPEQAAALALEDGEPAENLHVTLAYLGETSGPLYGLVDVLRPFALEHAALAGVVGGIGSFTDMGDGHPVLALPDVPGLNELRAALVTALTDADVVYAREHGFTPHLTLAYRPAPVFVVEALGVPLTFGELLIVRGDTEIIPLPLSGAPAFTAAAQTAPLGARGTATGTLVAAVPPVTPSYRVHGEHVDDGWTAFTPTADGWVMETGNPFHGVLAQRFAPGDHAWIPPGADEVIDVDALIARITARSKPVRDAAVAAAASPIVEGVGIAYDVTNPLVAEVLSQSGSQIVDIAHTTQLNVMRIIRSSYREGLSIPHTAQAIREGMADAAPARARLIARTELVGAVNGGSLAAVRIVEGAVGIGYHKVWMTAPGAKHPRHYLYDGLNNQARRLADKFSVGSHELDHPGDPEGPPGEICNCRCAMRYGEGPPPLL